MWRVPFAVVILLASLQAAMPRFPLMKEVDGSTDVAWLERLASDPGFAEAQYRDHGRNVGEVKGVRAHAYMRLGALATDDAIAAVQRIEGTLRHRSILPPPVVPAALLPHAAAHVSDDQWRIDDTLPVDGRTYAAFVLDFYGEPSVYLAYRDSERWSRPYLTSVQTGGRWLAVQLAAAGPGRLLVSFQSRSAAGQADPAPESKEIEIADILKDTDGDGWTDLEEAALGLNPRSADTDGDGIGDANDAAPQLAASAAASPDDEEILKRAIFAAFGLTGAPDALFVEKGATRVHPDSNPGPIIYTDSPGSAPHPPVFVTWRLLSRTGDAAVVSVSDYEGPLAASGNEVTLRRVGGHWFATSVRMLWIS